MDDKAKESLLSFLSSLLSRCHSLEQKVSIAESLLREHAPELHKEYLQTLSTPQFRGFSVSPSPELQELRKKMLRGPDGEAPSSE